MRAGYEQGRARLQKREEELQNDQNSGQQRSFNGHGLKLCISTNGDYCHSTPFQGEISANQHRFRHFHVTKEVDNLIA